MKTECMKTCLPRSVVIPVLQQTIPQIEANLGEWKAFAEKFSSRPDAYDLAIKRMNECDALLNKVRALVKPI